MGREIRRVPVNWEHPKDDEGKYKPMHDHDFDTALAEWLAGYELWKKGEHPSQIKHPEYAQDPYWEWEGAPPNPHYCRPKFEGPADWYQVYQTVSEGTPVTPPFATKAELVDYLVEHGDFWDQERGDGGWDREAAKHFVSDKWAPSLIMVAIDGNFEIKSPRGG